jgi:hypothetical protein
MDFPPVHTESFPGPPGPEPGPIMEQMGPSPSFAPAPGSFPPPPPPEVSSFPPPPLQSQPQVSFPPPPEPGLEQPLATSHHDGDIRTIKSACESSLREYYTLQTRGRYDDPAGEDRLRIQRGVALGDLRALREEMAVVIKEAESHRWRRWVFGGIV